MYQRENNLVILHIAPIQYAIDRKLSQGGTERVVKLLNKELRKLGIESQVAGCVGSNLEGVKYFANPLFEVCGDLPATYQNNIQEYEMYFGKVMDYAQKQGVSILHDHTGWLLLSEAYKQRRGQISFPILITLAPCYPFEKNAEIYAECRKDREIYFCVVSQSQKKAYLPYLDIDNVVYNGIDVAEFPFLPMKKKKDYLFSLGRIAWWKGQEIALNVAKRSSRRLALGGSIGENDYFNNLIINRGLDASIIKNQKENKGSYYTMDFFINCKTQSIYIGKLNDLEKLLWYKFALCFLMPILWDEPFGLVMIEAMACGTPVIAFEKGSVQEIVQDGKTGFIVESEDQMIDALHQIDSIDSNTCRRWVEDNFSSEMMAKNYLELYLRIIENRQIQEHRKFAKRVGCF